MSLLISFYRSLFDLNWLKSNKGNAKKAWGYFFIFMLFIILVQFGPVIGRIPGAVKEFSGIIGEIVPDFTATLKNGELTVDKMAQPYVFEDKESKDSLKVVVDTASAEELNFAEAMKEFDTWIYVTKSRIIVKDKVSGESSLAFSGMPDKVFSKADMMNIMNKFQGVAGVSIAVMLLVFMYIAMSAGKLIFLLAVSLLGLVVSSIAKRGWKFSEIYTVGLFAITLPTLTQAVQFWLGLNIPFVYTVILLVLMFGCIFIKDKKDEAPQSTPAQPHP